MLVVARLGLALFTSNSAEPQERHRVVPEEPGCLYFGLGLVADREQATQPGLAAQAETEESVAEAAAEEEPEPLEAEQGELAVPVLS